MPRFVILRHELPPESARATHWDLMLESGRTLRTWALVEEPASGREIAAEQLPDHRLVYLAYEGEVSGNRGCVTRWEEGEYELMEETSENLRLTLRGKRLSGDVSLAADGSGSWIFRVT